jgi:O-antigen biosynthesis protein
MTVSDPRAGGALTNGFLPAAAFVHDEPTAVGTIDLDRPLALVPPLGAGSPARSRDAIALVRVHGHCLAMLHLDCPVEQLDQIQLAQRVWAGAGESVRAHAEGFGCCAMMPAGPDDLLPGLGPPQGCWPVTDSSLGVSVVIPPVGRGDVLRRCLLSLAGAPASVREVIVVDNRPGQGDTEDIVRSIAANDPRFRRLAEPRPGYAVARNRGAAEARGEIVVFADDDVIVDPGWVDWLTAPFSDPGVGAVTGMVLPISLESPAQKRFERYAGYSKGLARRAYDLGEHRADDRFMYPFWGAMFGTGASMAFRRAWLIDVGGFDAALPSGCDTEALSVVVRSGARLVYEPGAVCWHPAHPDQTALERQVFHYGTALGAKFTKLLLTDPGRGVAAIVRSIPIVVAHRRRHAAGGTAGWTEPRDLIRAQRRGMLRGPWHYLQGRWRARRLGLNRVIEGR